jgi:hypothetical protein
MSIDTHSLPARADVLPESDRALFLFSDEIIDSITADEAKGIYTAERCPENKRNAIVNLLADGAYSRRRIAEIVQVDRRTIIAVEDRWPLQIEALRKKTVRKMRRAVDMQLERVEENPSIIPPSSIGLFIAQLTDKAELLDGRATSRVEEVHHVDVFSDWDGFIEKQLAPEDVTEINTLTSSKEMGLGGGKTLPIKEGESVVDAELSEQGDEDCQRRSKTDLESDGPKVIAEGNQTDIPTSIPNPTQTPDVRSAAKGEGAGGGSAPPIPAGGSTHKKPRKILANGADRNA